MNRKYINKRRMSMILCATFVLVLLGGCSKTNEVPKLKNPASETVQGVEIQRTDVKRSLILQGFVEPMQHGHYYSEQKEKVQYKVTIGQQVTKGQVLAIADGAGLEEQKSSLQRELANVQADLEYEKQRVIYENKRLDTIKKYGSQEGIEAATIEQQTLQIETDYQQQLLALQISNLNREINEINEKISANTLYASIDGYVSYISFSETASAHTNVVVLVDETDVYIRLDNSLDENVVDNYLYAYAIHDGKQQALEMITYSEKDKMLAEKNTMELATKFRATGEAFRSGDRVVVYVVLEEKKNTLAVPKSCIYNSDNGNYIYLVRNEKKEKCFVELGINGNTMTEIVSGVEEGDKVYYPVDETLTYEDKITVKKGVGYLKNVDLKTEVYYPAVQVIDIGMNSTVGTVTSINEEGFVEKGDVLATINITSGAADIRELQNQIDSLKKQYDLQKEMHEENIARLNEEIANLQKEQEASTDTEQPTTQQTTEATTEVVTEATTERETETTTERITETTTERITEVTTEATTEKPAQTSIYHSDSTVSPHGNGEGEARSYPLRVQIYLKQIALEMEKLDADKNARMYECQCSQLQSQLADKQKRIGNITIYAPCSGAFSTYLTEKDIGMKLRENAQIGSITRDDEKYLCVRDANHQLMFGNEVIIKDTEGKEHKGAVQGYYPSGIVNVFVEDAGGSYSYSINPNENQEKAYILLADEPEITEKLFHSADMTYRSEAINGAIVIDAANVKKDGDFGYVWIEKSGQPYKQYVEYLIISGKESKAYILNGLSEGDVLLTEVK